MERVPEPRIEPPDDNPVLVCTQLGCPDPYIYAGQWYYDIDGDVYCDYCGEAILEKLYKRMAEE